MRWTRWGWLFVAATLTAPRTAAQTPDPDVAKGVEQVMAHDYLAGAFTLDRAVRALSAKGEAGRDLAFGYFYGGIAYVGLGNETLGKLKISQGLLLMRSAGIDPGDVTVDASRFPPEVVRAVADARQQLAGSAAPAAAAKSPNTPPSPATAERSPRKPAAAPPTVGTAPPGRSGPRSSGGHRGLWIGLGAVAAAGAGVAVLKGGGSSSSASAGGTPTSSEVSMTFQGSSPSPGSTISVGGCLSGGCIDRLDISIGVVVRAGANDARVKVELYAGSQRCAVGFGSGSIPGGFVALSPGQQQTMRTNFFTNACGTGWTSTSVRVELSANREATTLGEQQFSVAYNFVR